MVSHRITILFALTLCLFLSFNQPAARAAELGPAVVTTGAFLLSDSPNIIRSGRNVHSLEGYLPIGTVIHLDEQRTIFNYPDDRKEVYFSARSELGFHGLIREDLFVRVAENPIAVPVGSSKIEFFTPGTTSETRRILLRFSRSDDVHLEIVEDQDPVFYDAILHRHKNVGNLPKIEHGRVSKSKFEFGDLKLVETKTKSQVKVAKWSSRDAIESKTLDKLAGVIRRKAPDELKNMMALLANVNSLQCILSTSTDFELAFKLFGSGLGFKLDAQLKDKGTLYKFETHILKRGNEAKTYTLLRKVICDGLIPEQMTHTTLQEGIHSPDKRVIIRLKDLAEANSKWIVTFQNEKVATKMIRISGWESYRATYSQLENMVDAGSGGYIAQLPNVDQQILINFLIQQIAFFEYRGIHSSVQ